MCKTAFADDPRHKPGSARVRHDGQPKAIAVVLVLLVALQVAPTTFGAEPTPLRLDDLYRSDRVTYLTLTIDSKSAIYCRQWVDPDKREYCYALWRVDELAKNRRPLEEGQPDARQPMLTPDGKRVLFLSTRPFHDGTPAF